MTDTAVAISERRSIHPVLWGFLIVFFYFFVWFIQRIPSIVNNTLWHEDYALLVSDQYQVVPGHEYTYLRSYRPLFYLEYHIIEFIYPGHLGTVVPKILGGFYLAITGLITSTLLKKWKAQPVAAFLIPLFFLCHPVLNEISIWNVAHYNSLVVLLLVAGVALWDEFSSRWRQVLGSLIILLGTLGYPIYLTIPVILFITEYTLKRLNGLHFSFRQLTWKLGIIVMITGLFFISAEITRTYMKSHHMPYDNRTFSLWNFVSASPSFLALKFREVRRIYMNLFLPIFSFYLGLGKALKVWKIIPISLALAMLIVARLSRLNPLYAIVMALIPFLPGLAHMTINSVQTEWRMGCTYMNV